MCDPVSLSVATFAIGATQAVTSFVGQNHMSDQNAANVISSTNTQYAYMQNRMEQERRAGVQQITENRIQALRAGSTAETAAGEAGVVGLSVDHLLGDIMGRQGRFTDSVNQNFEMQRDSLLGQEENVRAQGQSRINAVPRGDPMQLALGVAGSAVGAASGYFRMSNIDSYRGTTR